MVLHFSCHHSQMLRKSRSEDHQIYKNLEELDMNQTNGREFNRSLSSTVDRRPIPAPRPSIPPGPGKSSGTNNR